MRRLVPAAVLLLAGTASADPVLDRVTSAVVNGRRLDVMVEATFGGRGEVAIAGSVNGRTVSVRKRARPGHRTLRLKVDAKRLGLRALTDAVHFDLTVAVRERDGLEVTQAVTADIPVPCVILPGFGNESTPGGFAAFATALDLAAGGPYATGGERPMMFVHEYPSLTESLATLGEGVGTAVRSALKRTVFAKVDLVGYSYGGVVVRSFLSQGGSPRVRRCVFLGTPNEGTPIAYVAVGLSDTGQLDQFLGDNAALSDLAAQLLTPDAKESLRNLYPTYSWATFVNPLTQQTGPVPDFLLEAFLGDSSTPLTALNAVPPAQGVSFDAFFYTSTGLGQLGTVDTVDLGALQSGGAIDPAAIANGSGDGVVPARSVRMDEVSAWRDAITDHDMGAGSHLTLPLDPIVLAGVAAVLAK